MKLKSQTLNMTEGSPVKLILIFSIPMLIGNIFQQLYNLADSVIVGQLIGADALAAIGATGSIGFFFFAICNGFGSGGGIITSHFFGEGDASKVKNCIVNTAYIMLVVPLCIGTLAFCLASPLLHLLQTPEEIFAVSLKYLRITCIGLIFVSAYNFASSILRALGDSKTPLYFLIFSTIINVILDFVFVLGFKMGVVGAGVATIISQFLSAVLCLLYAFKTNEYFKFSAYDLRFNSVLMWKCVRLGFPLSLQFSLIAISCMALQRVVNSYGPTTVAAFTATSRIEQLIHMPYQTLAAALSTFVGQNFGAKKNDRAILGFKKCMIMMFIITAAMVPLMQIFGRSITRLFVSDTAVIDMGAQALKITSWFYVFLGIIYVTRGILNGIGDAFFALLNGIVEVVGRFFVPILLTRIPSMGVWGIWWSVGVVWFMAGVSAYLRYLYERGALLLPSSEER